MLQLQEVYFGIAALSAVVFVVPTLMRLVGDSLSRSTPNYSWIPKKWLYICTSLIRLGVLAAMVAIAIARPGYHAESMLDFILWGSVLFMFAMLHFGKGTKYRLHIDAKTGLITLGRLSRILSVKRNPVAFIDEVDQIGDSPADLFGLANLAIYWSLNGGHGGGNVGNDEFDTIRRNINDYLDAFARHDTPEKATIRAAYRQNFKRKNEAKFQRAAREEESADAEALAKKSALEQTQAQQELDRQRRLDDKFR